MEDLQAATVSQTALTEQMTTLQREIQDLKDSLQDESNARQDIKDSIKCKEQMISELQDKIQNTSDLPRRSERVKVQTEKMIIYLREEMIKREKRMLVLYEQWKAQARETREKLKEDITVKEMSELADIIEERRDDILKLYSENRTQMAPSSDVRRKIDACEAVTKEIIGIILERISGVDGDFDADREKARLRELLEHDYAISIYGSTAASNRSQRSSASHLTAKRAEAAAELAAKEVEYEVALEEQRQQEKIRALEEEHKKQVAVQNAELERLRAQRDVKAARARFEAYDRHLLQVGDVQSITDEKVSPNITPKQPLPAVSFGSVQTALPTVTELAPAVQEAPSSVTQLAQAVQDSIRLNKLPTPEPTVFSGDPMHFIEWKSTFTSLIDQRGISAADKLYYLKRYVTGSARKCIEGTFFRSDEAAYKDAWDKLNQRYGQPFIIQKSFREKLSNWPKVQSRDADGLRTFADFLNACMLAMPHVKGLQILNDCEENQKLLHKLPDWINARWNRQVTKTLMEGGEFPSFSDFASFLSVEAEVACNPFTSIHALRYSETNSDKGNTRERKGNKASVFKTNSTEQSDTQSIIITSKDFSCVLCQIAHPLHKCPDFLKLSLENRRKFVKEKKLCYGCLKQGHNAKDCKRRFSCDTCSKRHPTCLHDDNYWNSLQKETQVSVNNGTQVNSPTAATAMSLNVARPEHTISTSMIVPVWLSTANNPLKEKLVYALLDTQSDAVFIDQDVTHELQADVCPVKLKLTTMMGKNAVVSSERVSDLLVRGYNSATVIKLPTAYSKDCIPANREHIPTCETAKQWSHLLPIADEIPPLLSCEISLLIGYTCPRALAPKQVILGKDNEPYALQTDLGWSIVGNSDPEEKTDMATRLCHRCTVKEVPPSTPADAIRVLERDFKDAERNEKTVSQEDLLFLQKLEEGIVQTKKGNYKMPLPFRKRPQMPTNRKLAESRLSPLKRKLMKDQKYKEDYMKFMNEMIKRGDAEETDDIGPPGETWYIPHHGVYHPKKPDRLRIVFDCSAKHNGTCLNDHLLNGPDMINSLTGVLMRFRQHKVALMCDIEKMFHQFQVKEDDRNYLRFLWWKDGDVNSQPQAYRMTVHLFGAASSPGCANYGLKHLAKENRSAYPVGSQFITRDFYVDDGVTSVQKTEDAIQLVKEARELCAKGGLRLHKFVSNNTDVLNSIPTSELATDTKTKDLTFKEAQTERALGIYWNVEKDCFTFNIMLKDQPPTRQGILSAVAAIYDPLGFLAPYVLNGKGILQEMCRQGTDWDDPIPDHLRPWWECWKGDLQNLKNVQINRCYAPAEFGEVIKRELHHFSDASTAGYGQCTHLRLTNKNKEVHCAFVMGKARVSPTKVTTIPRLELTAATVSVTVSKMLKEELLYDDVEEFFWTDSKVTLGYINNEAGRFHTFVANRVQKIRSHTSPQQWFHVPTDENPADMASRGTSVKELLSSNWLTGPQFLWKGEIQLPTRKTIELQVGDPEVRKVQTLNTQAVKHASLSDHLTKFSSWSRAVSAVARLRRYLLKDKSKTLTTVAERKIAETVIIKDLQGQVYHNENFKCSASTRNIHKIGLVCTKAMAPSSAPS
ncbi:uncharacterized protein [Nothobranchius furzeri]|uniref:uncharacterized protein n=1 Tax=Nothobranchius furzeri TaxID=105023 RepID=UPI0039049349